MKMIIFASTNDSVQFHEIILDTFLNRKFSMYFDDDNEIDDLDDVEDLLNDEGDFISNGDDGDSEMMGMNLKKTGSDPKKAKIAKKAKKQKPNIKKSQKNNMVDVFALYGNMDQHKRAEILAKYCKCNSGILICTVSFF
jgi:hypothetical protein